MFGLCCMWTVGRGCSGHHVGSISISISIASIIVVTRTASKQSMHPSIRPTIQPSIGSGQAQSSLSACIQAVEIDVRYPFRLQRYSVIHYSAEPVEDVTRMRKEHLQSKRASSSPGLAGLMVSGWTPDT